MMNNTNWIDKKRDEMKSRLCYNSKKNEKTGGVNLKIDSLHMENFMVFDSLDTRFSPQINVIFGENSTGKTALIKMIYSVTKSLSDVNNGRGDVTAEKIENALIAKMAGVFMPENEVIGRLVYRQQRSNRAEISMKLSNQDTVQIGFGNRQKKNIDLSVDVNKKIDKYVPIFIPPKEFISSTANFTSLYEEYHIAMEETYYDLAKLLLKPLKKGPNTKEQNTVLSSFYNIINGDVVQKDNKFFLKVHGVGEFEMGLVSEGYRKLSTLIYLILSGSLDKNAILFWDEPESNMNPKMISHVTAALVELAKMGVQVFITTHSYFVQQSFNLLAEYPKETKNKVDIQFMSLYKEEETGKVLCETGKNLSDIEHNAVMEEFDAIYDREQELM